MPARATNPRAKMPANAYFGKPTIRIVATPIVQAEAAPRAKVRFELPERGGHLDPEYEAPWCPVWTDRRRPARANRLRAWLRRVRNALSCFN